MSAGKLLIGWAATDITPEGTVAVYGQWPLRVSKGVMDPLTATALAFESIADDGAKEQAVMVSCDLVNISAFLRDGVRKAIAERVADLDPAKVVIAATHTHEGPPVRPNDSWAGAQHGIELRPAEEWLNVAIPRIADAVAEAWGGRAPGGISYGLGQAVVGHNRRWVNQSGVSRMYGQPNTPVFSHIEGYEDHGLNLLFTWDAEKKLTGMVVNLACPSQETEGISEISADFWHETRCEIRKRHGEGLFILPQCSAAGDQSPHNIIRKAAEERMLKLKGRTGREEIAQRIANGVDEVLPYMEQAIDMAPEFAHRIETVHLTRRMVTDAEAAKARSDEKEWLSQLEAEQARLAADPKLKEGPEWWWELTKFWKRVEWCRVVATRVAEQKVRPRIPVELHVIRLGDVAIGSNPFEYFLDFATRIIARSPAVQTFLIQLAGDLLYVPSERAVAGQGYGSEAGSNVVGPEGGHELVEHTLRTIESLWPDASA